MTNRQLGLVAAAVAAVLAVIIVLLATGGPPTEDLAKDASNDVVVSDGPGASTDQALADIRSARVYQEASQIVFEAEMAAPIPERLKNETMSWRWEILEGGSETWIVSASASVDRPIASVLQVQGGNYGASTNDETLPGSIDWSGDTLYVRLNAPQIKNFPGEFTWRLETTLDGDRGDPESGEVTDTAPESGLGEYPPP